LLAQKGMARKKHPSFKTVTPQPAKPFKTVIPPKSPVFWLRYLLYCSRPASGELEGLMYPYYNIEDA